MIPAKVPDPSAGLDLRPAVSGKEPFVIRNIRRIYGRLRHMKMRSDLKHAPGCPLSHKDKMKCGVVARFNAAIYLLDERRSEKDTLEEIFLKHGLHHGFHKGHFLYTF